MYPTKYRSYARPFFGIQSIFDDIPVKDLFNQSNKSVAHSFAANVQETKDAFVIDISAAGFVKSDFEIKVEEQTLKISAERKETLKDESAKFTRREFHYGKFQRTFSLPENVDGTQITAHYENGILSLNLPKKQEEKTEASVQIEVK